MNRRAVTPWIALLALLNGLLWASLVPPWQAVDEPKHFELARLIAERGRLVTFDRARASADPELEAWIIESMSEQRFWWYGHAPGFDPDAPRQEFATLWFMGAGSALARTSPLYHGLVALIQPHDRLLGLYLGRLVSVMLGVLGVMLAAWAAREAFPDDPLVRYGAPSFLALSPMFAFVHTGINNDALVNALAALAFVLLVRLLVRGGSISRWAMIGLVVAIAMATKRTAGVLVPTTLLAVPAWRATRARRPRAAIAVWSALVFLATACATLWWRGGGWAAVPESWRWRALQYLFNDPDQPARIAAYLRAPGIGAVLRDYAWGIHNGFWASFGWQMVNLPPAAYVALAAIGLLGAGGLLRGARRARWTGGQRAVIVVLGAAVLVGAAAPLAFFVAYLNLPYPVPPQGRYLYVVAVPIALLLVLGLGGWVPVRRRTTALTVLVAAMAAFDMTMLLGFVVPFFYR